MTPEQRELLVERYNAFDMTAAEEQEFIIQAATDNELYKHFRASRLVTRALEKNRSTMPSGHLEVREHALSLLATAPVAAPATAGAPERKRRWAPLWLTHAATAILFATGGYFAGGSSTSPSTPVPPTVGSVPQSSAPSTTGTPDVTVTDRESLDQVAPAAPRSAAPRSTSSGKERPVVERKLEPSSSTQPEVHGSTSVVSEPAAPTPKRRADSVRFRGQIVRPK